MSPCQPLLGLLAWCPFCKSSLYMYNSFEDQGTCRFHLKVPNLQMSWSNLTRMRGYQDINSRYDHQVTCPILCILDIRRKPYSDQTPVTVHFMQAGIKLVPCEWISLAGYMNIFMWPIKELMLCFKFSIWLLDITSSSLQSLLLIIYYTQWNPFKNVLCYLAVVALILFCPGIHFTDDFSIAIQIR